MYVLKSIAIPSYEKHFLRLVMHECMYVDRYHKHAILRMFSSGASNDINFQYRIMSYQKHVSWRCKNIMMHRI